MGDTNPVTLRECMCGDFAVPEKITIQEEFEDKELVIHNFPVFKCFQCDEITLSPKDHVEYYKNAVKHYETTNETEFDCSLSQ
ncbi:hypothetical protein M3936_12920 [Sutcliffiella horikoshii]|uniref:hypothetical protein n=1 Tax=Sutcliffiella horikoshii TaxID=79883 RepID=UPI00203F706B|nr:hypothetical protein [Sutcliffiella horikoshii]MCM3618484.1 hypothetical protein [Sutcliffiella horikoshii]